MNGNRKLFWKVSNEKGGKLETCNRIKDGNGRLAQERMKYKGYGRIILKTCII